jgi:hypothetical protein
MQLAVLALAFTAFQTGQAHSQPAPSWPTIIFNQDAKRASEFYLQPPDSRGARCANRIASYGHPMTVAELAGGGTHPVRDIRVIRYVPAGATEDELRTMLLRVWQGKFESAECFQPWAEGAIWRCEVSIEFYVGEPAELITDGYHVYIRDRDGRSWFIRIPVAGQ